MQRRLKSVLVVYKKSAYQIYVQDHRNAHIADLIKRGDPSVAKLIAYHEENQRSLAMVKDYLKKRGIRSRWVYRAKLKELDGYDLVLSVGGDGTLLEAAHKIMDNTPLIGLTSSSGSVGFLCSASVQEMDEILNLYEKGALPCSRVSRIIVTINDTPLHPLALNDVLFVPHHPGMTARYEIHFNGLREDHRSSGIWFSTATGSTAGIRSAGGKIMPMQSRRLQYLVRELYHPPQTPPPSLRHGFIKPDESISLISKMRKGFLLIDGIRVRHTFQYGDKITIQRASHPLCLMGNFDKKREFKEDNSTKSH